MLDMNIFLLKILKINMYNVHANFCNALTVQCYVLNLPSHLLQSLRAYLRFAIQQSTFLNPGFFTNPPLMIWWSWLPFLQEYIIWNLTEWNMLALLSRWSCLLPGPGFFIGTRTSKSSTISTGSGSSLSLWFIFGKKIRSFNWEVQHLSALTLKI